MSGIFRLAAKEPFTGALVPNYKEKESRSQRSCVAAFSFPIALKQVWIAVK